MGVLLIRILVAADVVPLNSRRTQSFFWRVAQDYLFYTMSLYSLESYLLIVSSELRRILNLKGVEIIRDPKKARVFVDPMRREILRFLAYREMTEDQLAKNLGLSNASVGHHLRILGQSGLIRMTRRIIEKHGISQKFYEANALLYLVDSREMPLEIERYLMPMSLERVRGMIAAAEVLAYEPKTISSDDVEKFSKTVNLAILQVASRYSKRSNLDREELISLIYQDALALLLKRRDSIPEKARVLLERPERIHSTHIHRTDDTYSK